MRILLIVLLASIGSVGVLGQSVAEKIAKFEKPKHYNLEYDKFNDRTTIQTPIFQTKTSKGKMNRMAGLTVSLVYDGDKYPRNPRVFLRFTVRGGEIPRDPSIIFLVGDERITISDGESRSTSRVVGGGYGLRSSVIRENTVAFVISIEDLSKIAVIGTEFKLGFVEAVLDDDSVRTFRELLSLMPADSGT